MKNILIEPLYATLKLLPIVAVRRYLIPVLTPKRLYQVSQKLIKIRPLLSRKVQLRRHVFISKKLNNIQRISSALHAQNISLDPISVKIQSL